MCHYKREQKKKKKKKQNPEVYLEISRTSAMELLRENNLWLKVVNYFRKKSSFADGRLSSKYAFGIYYKKVLLKEGNAFINEPR